MNILLKNTILLSFSLVSFSIQVKAQTGCTDANANNFNPSATQNDGSCTYPNTSYSPTFISSINNTADESSGLIHFNNSLWTHNDSGNPAELYQIDSTNGNITRTVYVRNTVNTDWEAMTQNTTHIFIGDFGNNAGNRQDLAILKISKNDITNSDSVDAEFIYFNYPEQSNFTPSLNNSNFDCEAFLFHNDSLHLFTKNWVNLATAHYVLPAISGTFPARLSETLEANGLITDASIDENSGNIVLLGYRNVGFNIYTSFTWLLTDYSGDKFFSGNKRRIEIGNALQLGQTEGICLRNESVGFISAESISNSTLNINEPAKLHRFDFTDYLPQVGTSSVQEQMLENSIHVYPNPVTYQLLIRSNDYQLIPFSIYNSMGQLIFSGQTQSNEHAIDTYSFPNGIYYLYMNGNRKSVKFIVQK